MRPALLSAAVITALLLGGSWYRALAGDQGATLDDGLFDLLAPDAAGRPSPTATSPRRLLSAAPFRAAPALRAAIVLHVRDCSGNLRALELLAPHRHDGGLIVTRVWFEGRVRDSVIVRRALPDFLQDTPLSLLPARGRRALTRLGHRHSPILLIADATPRLRLVAPSPRDPRELLGLRRVLEHIHWSNAR